MYSKKLPSYPRGYKMVKHTAVTVLIVGGSLLLLSLVVVVPSFIIATVFTALVPAILVVGADFH